MKEQQKNKWCIWAIFSFVSFFVFLIVYLVVYFITSYIKSIYLTYGINVASLFGVFDYLIVGSIFLPMILGAIALIRIHYNQDLRGKRLAIAGILLGLLIFVFLILILSGWGQSGRYG